MQLIGIMVIVAALFAFLCASWIYPKVHHIAKMKGIVDNPNARKLQKAPVPVLGGIAVYFGLLMGLLLYHAFAGAADAKDCLLPMMLGVSVMLYVGSIDDILGLTPWARIVIEMVAVLGLVFGSGMCIDSLFGLWGVYEMSWWIAVPLTVFAGVGLINAFNMVDGVNGLSSGLCITICAFLSIIFWKRCDYANCTLTLCFSASLVPFLLHNVFGKRSKMFIGDGGTMVMGFIVTWLVIKVLSVENVKGETLSLAYGEEIGLVAMMLAVASVPVFDTLRVMTCRMMNGVSPFRADRTHLHHVLIDVGVSHSITALCEIFINSLVVLAWYASYKCGLSVTGQLYATIAVALLLVWGTYFFLSYHKNRETATMAVIRRFTEKTHLGHKMWWLSFQQWLDHGTYEDYLVILGEYNMIDSNNISDDKRKEVEVVNRLQGRHFVRIDDLAADCHEDVDTVRRIIAKIEADGIVSVKERDENGNAITVKLKKI